MCFVWGQEFTFLIRQIQIFTKILDLNGGAITATLKLRIFIFLCFPDIVEKDQLMLVRLKAVKICSDTGEDWNKIRAYIKLCSVLMVHGSQQSF